MAYLFLKKACVVERCVRNKINLKNGSAKKNRNDDESSSAALLLDVIDAENFVFVFNEKLF